MVKWAFKLRGLLMLPPMVFLTLCTRWEVENETLVFGVGGGVFIVGLVIRIWSQMHLHYRLRVSKVLTITGPYQIVRNPIYLGNALMLVGSCFLAELFWFAPVMLAYVALVYSLVVRHEEAHLCAKYGQPYQQYLNEVPRWLPRARGEGSGIQDGVSSFLWPSVLAEAHNLLLLVPFVIKELCVG